jgi:long-chain fatty acid transport protein
MRYLICLLVLVISQSVFASGFMVARFGGEHGHPMTDNPTALYYNPAALTLGKGTRLYIDATLAYRSVTYTRPAGAISDLGGNTPTDALSVNSGTAQLNNWAAAPFMGLATDFGVKGLGVAIGISVPFGGGASWSPNDGLTEDQKSDYIGGEDGVQRWWSIDSSLKTIYYTLAVAYQVHKKISFGLALNYVSSSIDTIRGKTVDGSDDLLNSTGGLKEGRSYLSAKGKHFSLGAGLLYQPNKDWRIGYSYQSQPDFGEMRMSGTLNISQGNQPGSSTPKDLLQEIPDLHRFGIAWRMSSKVELRLFGDYIGWSALENQCIVEKGETCSIDPKTGKGKAVLNIIRQWEDAWGLRLGASYWLNDDFELYTGGGYDGNAAPDQGVDPSLFDMDKISLAAGLRMNFLTQKLRVAFTYTQVIYFSRDIALQTDSDGIATNGFAPPSRSPSAAGKYEQAIGVGNLNIEYRF